MLAHSVVALAAAGVAIASPAKASSIVPSYVVDYAPVVYLYSKENFFPSDLQGQLNNTTPLNSNRTALPNTPSPLTLDNLNQLNTLDGLPNGTSIYLSANDDFVDLPPWIRGVKPDSTGKSGDARSCAIITHDKGNGTVDAFYMYFYAYNRGNTLFGEEFGDHVGDWEHNMIRFIDGAPAYVWYSQHSFGEAFTYSGGPKTTAGRVVSYSANGTHANYATAGQHEHLIPDITSEYGPLLDYTDNGTLWDPTLSAYFFNVTFPASNGPDDDANPTFTALTNPIDGTEPPVNWLYFQGQWGNEQLPNSNPNQKNILGISVTYKYTDGPNGPQFKDLNRSKVCPPGHECIIKNSTSAGS